MSETLIPVLIARSEQRLILQLRDLGAISTSTAQPLSDLRSFEEEQLRRLITAGLIQETAHGEYYLDEIALNARTQRQRKRMLFIIAGVILAMLAIIALAFY